MIEQDYVMRMIREMVRAILKIMFHIDTETPAAELLEAAEDRAVLERLCGMTDEGRINEAENDIYALVEDGDQNGLKIALLFYSYLNEKSDAFLETNNFSRAEVEAGVRIIAGKYGLDGMIRFT